MVSLILVRVSLRARSRALLLGACASVVIASQSVAQGPGGRAHVSVPPPQSPADLGPGSASYSRANDNLSALTDHGGVSKTVQKHPILIEGDGKPTLLLSRPDGTLISNEGIFDIAIEASPSGVVSEAGAPVSALSPPLPAVSHITGALDAGQLLVSDPALVAVKQACVEDGAIIISAKGSPPAHAGPPAEAGPPADPGPPADAGPPADPGPPTDAGPPADAGPPTDTPPADVCAIAAGNPWRHV